MVEFGFVRAETFTEISLWNKFGSPLRRNLVQITSKTCHVRAKATATLELSLLSKLGRVTKLKPGRGAIVGGNPEGF